MTEITNGEIAEWKRWFVASPYAQTGIVEILDLAMKALVKEPPLDLEVSALDIDAIYDNPKFKHLRRVK